MHTDLAPPRRTALSSAPLPNAPLHSAPLHSALLCGVVLTLLLLPAVPASAHDVLERATPAPGSTVTELDRVALAFAAPLVDLGGGKNGIIVTDAAGRHFETACATVSGDDLSIPVSLGGAGTYDIQWRGVSQDGHIVGNTYAFTYRPADSVTVGAGSATGPSCGASASGPVAAETPQGASPVLPIVIGVISGVVVLVVLLGVILLIVRLRRTPGGAA